MSLQTKLCRLCNNSDFIMLSVFDNNLLHKISTCIRLKIDSEDRSLPLHVCELCSTKIDDFYEFQENCLKVQIVLENSRNNKTHMPSVPSPIQPEAEERHPVEFVQVPKIEITDVKDEQKITNDCPTEESHPEAGDEECEQENLFLSTEQSPKPENSCSKTKTKRKSYRKSGDGKQIYKSLLMMCEECGTLIERNRMEGHRNRHLNINPFHCSVADCGLAFPCRILLRLHKNNRHGTDEMPCDQCGKIFYAKTALKAHKKRVHGKKTFPCKYCDQVFVTNAILNKHLPKHFDKREFQCPECPKAFYRKSNLTVHLRCHTKEKPFTCVFCDKAYAYRRLMKDHVARYHTNQQEDSDKLSNK